MSPRVVPPAAWVLFATGAVAAAAGSASAQTPRLYWTDKDDGQLEVADTDGANRVTLLSFLADPRGIAVDVGAGKLYWASHEPAGAIFTAGLEGEDPQVFVSGLSEPVDIALDVANGLLYWVEEGAGRIARCSLASPGSPEVLLQGLNRPYYLEIDPAGGFLYWSDFDSGVIHRATTDGEGAAIFITGQDRVRDVAAAGGVLFWCDRDTSQIRRRDIAGAGPGTVLFSGAADSLDRPHGLCLDAASGTMFWTDTDNREINSGAMDGSGAVTTLVSTSLTGAWGIALARPAPTPYALWLAQHFDAGQIADPDKEATLWGEAADPDRDSLPNLLEFAQGSDPIAGDGAADGMIGSVKQDAAGRFYEVVVRIRRGDPSLLWQIESSVGLAGGAWQIDGLTEVPPRTTDPADADYELATFRTPAAGALLPTLFVRLRVWR